MRKIISISATVSAIAIMTSCTRVRSRIVNLLESDPKTTECNIGTLYPNLDGRECVGVMSDNILYTYQFRYRATPEEVESALMKKTCSYIEIIPDTTLQECSREYILANMSSRSIESYPTLTEWKQSNHPDSLVFYKCCRTPLQHLLVFDKKTGFVYHKIYEFKE